MSHVCEREGSSLFLCFADLEKACDRADRMGEWEILKMCGIRGLRTLGAVKGFMTGVIPV